MKKLIIREACNYYNWKFPEELWTGVLFYKGYKITIEEFNDQVKIFKR